ALSRTTRSPPAAGREARAPAVGHDPGGRRRADGAGVRLRAVASLINDRQLRADLGQKLRAVVLYLQKCGVFAGRLVDIEDPQDAQRRGALQRPDKARVAIEKARLSGPMDHLGRAEEITARVRIARRAKRHWHAERFARDLR